MASYYIDLSNGNNANSGTELLPWKDFTNLNTGGWDTHIVYIKRGTRGVVTSSSRANIVAPTSCTITCYGNATDPLPIVSGGITNFNPIWLQEGSNILVEKIHVTEAAASGIVVSPVATKTLSNIIIRDVIVTENTQNNSLWGTDGVQVGGFSQTDSGLVTNVLLERVVAIKNGGHGIKVRGRASNVKVKNSYAVLNGLRTPAHGMGTAGHFAELNNTSSGGSDIRTGWTNISGNIWEHALTAGNLSSVSSWFAAYVGGAGVFGYYKLNYSATPATPGPGECGIGANNTIRINLNGTIAPTDLTSLYGIFARPEYVEFRNCIAGRTVDNSTQIEGQGIYFDNGSYQCFSYDCVSYLNDGHGFYLNDATNSGHYRGFSYLNGKAGVGIGRGDGTNINGCVLICKNNTPGIQYQTGNQRGKANKNIVYNASVGITTNDSITNNVVENENLYINCTTRLNQVASPGSRSSDSTVNRTSAYNLQLASLIKEAETYLRFYE